MRYRVRSEGITLTEVIIAMAITALLAAMAAPSFGAVIERHRTGAVMRQFVSSLHLARTAAIMSGRAAVICTSRNGFGCDSTADWSDGWLVFEDFAGALDCNDANGDAHCDGHGGRVLHVVERLPTALILQAGSNNLQQRIRYQPAGTSWGYAGRITVCRASDRKGLAGTMLSNTGRVRRLDPDEIDDC